VEIKKMAEKSKKPDPYSCLYTAEFAMEKSNIPVLEAALAQALDGLAFDAMPERWKERALQGMGSASRETLGWLKAYGVDFSTPAHAAVLVKSAAEANNAQAIEFLAEEGATARSLGESAHAALAIACQSRKPKACQALLKLGVDPDGKGSGMPAPLLLAVKSRARNGDEGRLVESLLAAGARPDVANEAGPRALAMSLQLEEPTAFDLLFEATLSMPEGGDRRRALDEALCAACGLLSGHGPYLNDDYPMYRLPATIAKLLELGANPHAPVRALGCSPEKTSAFLNSVGGGQHEPEKSAFAALLKGGASPIDESAEPCMTALHVAARDLDQDKLAKFLEMWPASIDARDDKGSNAAMEAARHNQSVEAIAMLIARCDPTAIDVEGGNLAHYLDTRSYSDLRPEDRSMLLGAYAEALRRSLEAGVNAAGMRGAALRV
jgi:ankyrin repeat protein